MIAFLRGKLINRGKNYVILDVGGIGYKLYTAPDVISDFSPELEVDFYIHHYIKEDASDLYAFRDIETMELFASLLSISGVGPKSALGITAVAGVNELKESIAASDAALLTKVSGIGKKTAERIMLELGGKIDSFLPDNRGRSAGDEIDALLALGYSMFQARQALNHVGDGIKDSGQRIKAALKYLSR